LDFIGIAIEFDDKRSSDVTLKLSLGDRILLWNNKKSVEHEFVAKRMFPIAWRESDIPADIK